MTRTFSALAVALIAVAVLFASPVEACISCEYTPEVVNTPVGKQGQKAKRAQKKQPSAKKSAARPEKKRVSKKPPANNAKPAKIEATAKAAPIAPEPEAETEPTKSAEAPDTGIYSGSGTAAFAAEAARSDGESGAEERGERVCRRFSAQIGTTVVVPCD